MAATFESKLQFLAETRQAAANVRALRTEVLGVADAGRAVDQNGKPFDAVTQGATKAQSVLSGAAATMSATAAAVSAAADKTTSAGAKASAATAATAGEATKSLRQTRNELRLMSQQFTDITVGLATGQSPLMVLLQQGGQLKDVFGGVGNAVRAVASVFTPFKVLVGGVAAAMGTFAAAAYEGHKDLQAIKDSLALTGNQAGVTVGYLGEVSSRITQFTTATATASREAVKAVVDTGTFAAASTEVAARAAIVLARLTDQSAGDVAKNLAEMANGVTEWSIKANKAYAFLTAAQVDYIRSLEAQGRTQEAMRVTLGALNSTLEQRSAPAVGYLEKAWIGVAKAVSDAWNAMKDVGKDRSATMTVGDLTEKLERLQKARDASLAPGRQSQYQNEIDKVQLELDQRNSDARRAAERAIDTAAEQQKIKEQTKAWTDQLAQIELAGNQKRLAQRLAALDAEQAAVELAAAQGVRSAAQVEIELNKIEQRRLAAQRDAVQEQLRIEAARTVEKPEDKLAKQAAVTQLEAQLVEVQGKIRTAATAGRAIVEADALSRARELAQQWAQVWQEAFDQVRKLSQQNALGDAGRLANSQDRATAEARAANAELDRQLQEQIRKLNVQISLTLAPEAKAELQKQLDDLAKQGGKALDENSRKAQLTSYSQQAAEVLDRISNAEARIDAQVAAGQKTFAEAETEKLALRAKELAQLQELLPLLEALASTPAEKNAVDGLKNRVQVLGDLRTEMEKTARSAATDSITQALDDISTKAKSGKEALLDMVGSFAKSMLHVINQRLAEKLVDSIFKAIGGNGGPGSSGGGGDWLSLASKFIGSFFHTGGVLGSLGGMRGSVSPAAFIGAPRYHTGGILGLMPNLGLQPGEIPLIGKVGEEMLTEDNPRHINNIGKMGGVTYSSSVQVNGAQGSDSSMRSSGEELERRQRATFMAWLQDEQRPGGILAAR